MHPNSIDSYQEGRRELFGKRHQKVIAALRASRLPMTDREVMIACDFVEPNQCRPRLTELIECGVVVEVGSKECPVTRRTVRLVRLATYEAQALFDLGEALTPKVIETLNRRSA